MNKSDFFFISCLLFVTTMHTMDLTNITDLVAHRTGDPFEQPWQIPHHYPQDLGECLIRNQLLDIHNQVNTPEEARNYLVSVSLVNKECNTFANGPHVMKKIISNLSATLRNQRVYIWYEEQIAKELNIPAAKKYLDLNNQFFSKHITVKDVKNFLKQGADPNYRRDIRNKNALVNPTRQCYSGCPLTFYASDPSDNGLSIVKCLLQNGADVNTYTNYCYPLNAAINNKLVAMVKLLLRYNPIFANVSGTNCIADAISIGNSEIISLLQKAYPNHCKYGLKTSITKGNTNRIQELFDHGARPDDELEYVVEQTLYAPTHRYSQGVFASTELLQLFCNNGVQDQLILETVIARARATKKCAKEVLAMLEKCNTKS